MNINHAVLHVFDPVSCVNVYSQVELDLFDKLSKRYTEGHVRKTLGNIDACRGSFAEESAFAEELRAYFRGERGFLDLSVQIAEFLMGELGHADKADPTDILVVDFEDDPDASVRAMDEAEERAAFEGRGRRYFALMLLDIRQAYLHEVGTSEEGATRVSVARHRSILPNPSQKVSSFALVDARTLTVSFCDKPRTIAGEERWLIPDGLLQCTREASGREVLGTVARIAEEVAEEYGANAAVAVSRAKASASQAVEESEELAPWDLAEDVFEDEPLRKRFEEALAEEGVAERVPVERAVAKRVARMHRIRTDTGIDVSFPAEYGENPDFIEFTSEPDGHISISLKNIGRIENR